MANITLYSGLNSWTLEELAALDLTAIGTPSLTASSISGYVGGFYIHITGSFSYSGGALTGGTFTGLDISYSSAPLLTLSDVSLDVEELAYGSEAEIMEMILGGDDVIQSDWAQGDTYHTLGGDDRIYLGVGDDVVNGGAGTDSFVLDTTFLPDQIRLSGDTVVIDSTKGTDSLRNVEIVEYDGITVSFQVGSAGYDRLTGDANAGVRRDFLYGRAGDDLIEGGRGYDRLFGHAGADELLGEWGADRLYGGRGNDILHGGRHDDRLFGQRGDDRLNGASGSDLLQGGNGRDRLMGGGGRDVLLGGNGDDVLTGDAGQDVFRFREGHGNDRITDFKVGVDVIEIASDASGLSDLEFSAKGSDVLVSFADVTVRVEDITVADLSDAGNFIF